MSASSDAIAADVIAQMADATFGISYTADYVDQYISDLQDDITDSTRKMQVNLAPVQEEYERAGWGATSETVTMGCVAQIIVANAHDKTEMGPLKQFVRDLSRWMLGPRKFAGTWSCTGAKPIYGDHYNGHLKTKSEFHVLILLVFEQHIAVN